MNNTLPFSNESLGLQYINSLLRNAAILNENIKPPSLHKTRYINITTHTSPEEHNHQI